MENAQTHFMHGKKLKTSMNERKKKKNRDMLPFFSFDVELKPTFPVGR